MSFSSSRINTREAGFPPPRPLESSGLSESSQRSLRQRARWAGFERGRSPSSAPRRSASPCSSSTSTYRAAALTAIKRAVMEAYYGDRGASHRTPLVAYQLNWKGENYYTGNNVAISYLERRPNGATTSTAGASAASKGYTSSRSVIGFRRSGASSARSAISRSSPVQRYLPSSPSFAPCSPVLTSGRRCSLRSTRSGSCRSTLNARRNVRRLAYPRSNEIWLSGLPWTTRFERDARVRRRAPA